MNLGAAYYFFVLCAATYGACILIFYQYIQGKWNVSMVIQALFQSYTYRL